MLTAGIGSPMDSVDEDINQALDINEDDIDDHGEDFYDDDDADIIIGQAEPYAPELDLNLDNQILPQETDEYFQTLAHRTMQLEQELEECDELLNYDVHSNIPRPSQSLVPYDDMKELEELAAEKGLTVEEFRRQLDDDDDFDEDNMDTGYDEIDQLQKDLAEARSDVDHLVDDIDEEVKEFLKNRENNDGDKPLAIEQGEISDTVEKNSHVENNGEKEEPSVKEEDQSQKMDSNEQGIRALILASTMTDMRQFVRQQLKQTDETLGKREIKLKQSMESHRHTEERRMMTEEQNRKAFLLHFEEEESILLEKKKVEETKIEEDLKNREGEMEEAYKNHQTYIDRLIEDYEGEKHNYETTQDEIQRKMSQRKRNAAVEIQRRYKGFRTRKQLSHLIQDLAERKELRQKEKYEFRVMEVQYELDYKAEQQEKKKEENKKKEEDEEKRMKEEEKKKELDRQEKEEAERIAKQIQEEVEMKKNEELEAEKRKQKEIEEERQLEEKKKKEEEKLRKEEERKRREEEKRLKKEQEKKKKEDEKEKREEEKIKKEEEKKHKMAEQKKRKDEEKRQEEEKKHRQIEERNEKTIHDNMKQPDDTIAMPSTIDKSSNNTAVLAVETSITTTDISQGQDNEVKGKNVSSETSTPQNSNIVNSTSSDPANTRQNVQIVSADQNSPPTSSSDLNTTIEKKNLELEGSSCNGKVSPLLQTAASSVVTKPTLDFKSSLNSTQQTANMSNICHSALAVGAAGISGVMSHQVCEGSVVNKADKPDQFEQLRLEWIKDCLPWSKISNEPWKLNQQTAVKVTKRPSSAKKSPPVSEAVILAAAQAESLRQVSSVKLTDLPGCSLSTLSQCWSLRYLTVSGCSLACLDGLSACKHLMYINAENNKIEFLDLRDLGALQCLCLSGNQLTATVGLDGCINLRWLDMSYNKIRRISGFSSLRRIHTLDLSHNQLTSSDGIELAVTLQEVNLSHNFLQAFEKVDKLCLLTRLNLAANNLLQPPVLKNQVLLQYVDLTENSLQSLLKLARYWLPLFNELKCRNNRLNFLDGLDKAVNLVSLDISDNQISDLESLKSGLMCCQNLHSLKVEGNPVVDMYASEYRSITVQTVPGLQFIDDLSFQNDGTVSAKDKETTYKTDNEFLQMCQTQIKLHQRLREQFESQRKTSLANNASLQDEVCSSIFSYCDTSFKIASEHRSSHEFGDVSVAQSISHFKSPARTCSESFNHPPNISSSVSHATGLVNEKSAQNMRHKFDSCLVSSQPTGNNSITINEAVVPVSSYSGGKPYHKGSHSSHCDKNISNTLNNNTHLPKTHLTKGRIELNSQDIVAIDSDDSDEMDGTTKLVDVTKDIDNEEDSEKKTICSRVPHPPPMVNSYLNEKDKFLMALEDGSDEASKGHRSSSKSSRISLVNSSGSYPNALPEKHNKIAHPSSSKDRHNITNTLQEQQMTAKEKFDMMFSGQKSSMESHTFSTEKNKFDQKFGDTEERSTFTTETRNNGNTKLIPGVKADVIGNHLTGLEKGQSNELGLDTSMDSDFDADNLDFDLEKYLDMGELDEFLEKGWRPADSPQIPQSNYPVLGRIQDDNGRNGNKLRETGTRKMLPAVPPPINPQQAWRDSPMSEPRYQPQSHHMPSLLPQPSPVPSSVASAAETLGGGSVKSRKEEIADEWGFKDSRTAEMMMARAKKMKYNADRKRKLNKLDPHQRYQLFRKLEESGKIQHVKPPPAKVMPRKEYFQAREEEVLRQEVERQMDDRGRVHRTYEWLHTQVGEHPISTSRINPMPAPVYSNNDGANRKTSPASERLDSASVMGDNFLKQARRYSVDENFNSQSPMLPPIKINSAPSHHKNERLSWRDNPVEKSGGWGGGKKHNGK